QPTKTTRARNTKLMTTRVLGVGVAFMPCRRPCIHRPIWSARVFVCNSLRCSAFMRFVLYQKLRSHAPVTPSLRRLLRCLDLSDDRTVADGGQSERRAHITLRDSSTLTRSVSEAPR